MTFAIIFDLDGTLIDTPRAIVDTFSEVLKSMRAECPDASTIRATIGLPLGIAFSQLLKLSLDDPCVAYAIKQYQALFKVNILPKAKDLIFSDVVEGLTMLRDQNYLLAVATSKIYASAEALLKAADLWKYFHLVVGADQVMQPKPHPEMGRFVMRELGVVAYNSVMVGDTTHDLCMARDLGMRSIAVTYGVHDLQKLQSAEPTWVADTFNEVLHYIKTEFVTGERHLMKCVNI